MPTLPRNRAIWVLTALCVCIAAVWWLLKEKPEAVLPPIYATVEHGDVENTVVVFGSAKPNRSVEVGAQVSGQLQKLHVREGQKVEEGDLVAEIDATVQRSRVEEQWARLRAQEAQLTSYQSKLKLAKTNAERQMRLLSERAASQASFESAEDQLVSWEANLVRLKSEIDQSRASLASEEALLGYSRIYAPMSGMVIEVRKTEGQTLIATQQTPVIIVIGDLDTMLVEASVSEADISKIAPGMAIRLLTIGGGPRQWNGVLGQILPSPKVEDNVVRYTTLFRVDNSDGALLPNMTAQIFIITSSARNVLTVPFGAVVFPQEEEPQGHAGTADEEGGTPVQVRYAASDGALELRNIRVGAANRLVAEVLSGLEEGDRVLVGTP